MIMQYLYFLLIDRSKNVPGTVLQWFGNSLKWSFVYGVPVEIILAVIWQESDGDSDAVGDDRTAFGLMQVRQIAVDDLVQKGYGVPVVPLIDPDKNIRQGTAFLNLLKSDLYSWNDALRGYNCCGTNFKKIKENQDLSKKYAEQVMEKAEFLGYAE